MTPTVGNLTWFYPAGSTSPTSAEIKVLNSDGTVRVQIAMTGGAFYDNVGVSYAEVSPVDITGFPNGCISDMGTTPAPPARRR